jgi:hypothetical protein
MQVYRDGLKYLDDTLKLVKPPRKIYFTTDRNGNKIFYLTRKSNNFKMDVSEAYGFTFHFNKEESVIVLNL